MGLLPEMKKWGDLRDMSRSARQPHSPLFTFLYVSSTYTIAGLNLYIQNSLPTKCHLFNRYTLITGMFFTQGIILYLFINNIFFITVLDSLSKQEKLINVF